MSASYTFRSCTFALVFMTIVGGAVAIDRDRGQSEFGPRMLTGKGFDTTTDKPRFGCSVAMLGNYILVGADNARATAAGFNTGVAYLFEKDWDDATNVAGFVPKGFWGQRMTGVGPTIVPPVGHVQANNRFGAAVALSTDGTDTWAFIGSPRDANTAPSAIDMGVVFIYSITAGAYPLDQKIPAPVATEKTFFGNSLAALSNRVAIGCPRCDDGLAAHAGMGQVHVYTRGGSWVSEQILTAPETLGDELRGAGFGSSVALTSQYIAVGAAARGSSGMAGDAVDAVHAGRVYLFTATGAAPAWNLVSILKPPDADIVPGLKFGASVSINLNSVMVGGGAPYADTVYVYLKNQGGANNWGLARTYPRELMQKKQFQSCAQVSDGAMAVAGDPHFTALGNKDTMYGAVFIVLHGWVASPWGGPFKWTPLSKWTANYFYD